eukprot:2430630-Rhodomonas_salina.2
MTHLEVSARPGGQGPTFVCPNVLLCVELVVNLSLALITAKLGWHTASFDGINRLPDFLQRFRELTVVSIALQTHQHLALAAHGCRLRLRLNQTERTPPKGSRSFVDVLRKTTTLKSVPEHGKVLVRCVELTAVEQK